MDGVKNKLPKLDPQSLEEEQPPQPKLPPKEDEVFNKVVEKVEEDAKASLEVVEQQEEAPALKKEKKKRVASDKLKEHLAKARAKSLETRRRNKALKQQKLAEANEQIQSEKKKNKVEKVVKIVAEGRSPHEEPTTLHREEEKPPITQTTPFNYEIDYDKIISGVSNRLMKNFEIEEPPTEVQQYRQGIPKREPPQQNYHKPIKTEEQIRQEERNAAKVYYEKQMNNKNLAYNTIQRGGRMPRLGAQNVDADIWERCFRR